MKSELPRYRFINTLAALKIKEVCETDDNGDTLLIVESDDYHNIIVDFDYMAYAPKAGGYYIVTHLGIESYLPQEGFEATYELVEG